jgi:hypothetical protein
MVLQTMTADRATIYYKILITEEYIRRIPPSVPPCSKKAFSHYILPFSSRSPQILPVVSHRLQKCLLVKLVKFNYTTIGYEPLLPVTRLRGLVRGYRCFDKVNQIQITKKDIRKPHHIGHSNKNCIDRLLLLPAYYCYHLYY